MSNPRSDGPGEPVDLPDGQTQCDECGSVVPNEQALTKQTPGDQPNIELCPVCQ